MFLASDNTGLVHPKIMEAVVAANTGYSMPYGGDDLNAKAVAKIRDIFEAPEAAAYFVSTGTAANVLALSTLTHPWETVFCSRFAHIHEDECNGPEFYMGGAKLTIVGQDDKITPDQLRHAIELEETRGVHGPQRGPVSITTTTEKGRNYSVMEITALTDVAKSYDLPVHMDGARFSNALVAQGCSPAEMTWKAGIDALSFGGTKNGCMAVEAVVFFDPKHAHEFELRRKRGAHLFSKHRYLSAQMDAYLTDDLWLSNARAANANCARLAEGLKQADAAFHYLPEANIIFGSLPRDAHQRLHAAGAKYYLLAGNLDQGNSDEMLPMRLVCDWALTDDLIDQFVALAKG